MTATSQSSPANLRLLGYSDQYQNAGLRVFSIANPFRPDEIASFVPEVPAGVAPGRPLASADVFVDRRGLVYLTDAAHGLHILEFQM